jgi:hypothetical protein
MLQSDNGSSRTVDPAPDIRVIREPSVSPVGRHLVNQATAARCSSGPGPWQTDPEVACEPRPDLAGRPR